MRTWLAVFFMAAIFPVSLMAEGGIAAPQGAGQQPSAQPRQSSTIQVFDDRVFDSIGTVPSAPDVRQGASGKVRYLAPEADYNYGQRQQWLDRCAPLKTVDRRRYRECFQNEKAIAQETLRRNLADVESGQGARNPYYPTGTDYRFDDVEPRLIMDRDEETYD